MCENLRLIRLSFILIGGMFKGISSPNRLGVEFRTVRRLAFSTPTVATVGRTYLWHSVVLLFYLIQRCVFKEASAHLERFGDI